MEISISTPALLFSAISLLLLAFTNRFLYLADLARHLHAEYRDTGAERLKPQLANLRTRLKLIRSSQTWGVVAFALCVASMFLVLLALDLAAKWVFAVSLTVMLVSLAVSLREILLSTRALEIELSEEPPRNSGGGTAASSRGTTL